MKKGGRAGRAATAALPLPPGELAGRYRLEHEAGSGPVASVWQAYDLRGRASVAIKVLDPRYTSDPRFAVRFREGCRPLAGLGHENLARLLDYGHDAGYYYLVTEWVDGHDLASELSRSAPLLPEDAASIVGQACAALAEAHARGLVHGGLKPQNILLGPDRHVKVTDLGLAGMIRETGLSKTQVVLSEAAYMAPERARGEPAGPESDVYALGVILYELLTGRLPFEAAGAWSLLRKQAEEMPAQPSAVNAQVPLDLAAVAMIALQKDRERRYPTADAMGNALAEGEGGAKAPDAARREAPSRPAHPRLSVGAVRQTIVHAARLPRRGVRSQKTALSWFRFALPLLVAGSLFLIGRAVIAAAGLADAGLAAIGRWMEPIRAGLEALPDVMAAVESTPTPVPLEIEWSGTVDAIGPEAWTISSRRVGVTGRTEIEGGPEGGDTVTVRALLDAVGGLTALSIRRRGGSEAGQAGTQEDPSAARLPLLAYYSIGFEPDSWGQGMTDFPLLGRYSGSDQEIMRQHVRWARQVGIDGFIVGWRSTDVLNARLAALVDIAAEEDFHMAIAYQGLEVESGPVPVEQIGADLDGFLAQYGRDPVFGLFGVPSIIWAGTWDFSPEDVSWLANRVQGDYRLLASERQVERYKRLARWVDGNAYYWSSVDPFGTPRYEQKLKEMGQAVHRSGGLWIAPAAPGFDGRPMGGTRVIDRNGGETLRREMEAASVSAPDAIGLISWNEFSENTHVEPSENYGMRYLEVVADLRGGQAPGLSDFDTDEPAARIGVSDAARFAPLLIAGFLIPAGLAILLWRRVRRPGASQGSGARLE